MFSLEQWLMLIALIALLLQGYQLRTYALSRVGLLIVVILPLITLMLSDYLAQQSVILLQQTLLAQSEFISVIVLLEALLTCFAVKGYKLPLISMFCSIVYGQMLFYQTGWFSWSFIVQGGVYGLGISVVLLLTIVLAKQQSRLPQVLIVILLGIIFLQSAQLPPPRQFELTPDYWAMIYSLGGACCLLLIGYVISNFQQKRIAKYTANHSD
jgi:hypothetical protein